VRYVELAVALGEHVEGLVFGAIDVEPRSLGREEIVAECEALLGGLDEVEDEHRQGWLAAQLRALLAIAREEQFDSFEEEVMACFGVEPRPIPEPELRAAHAALGEALPGGGPLAERYQRWLAETLIPGDQVPRVLRAVADLMQARTRELVSLPDGEALEIEVVTNERWVAFSSYLGGLRSKFLYNADLPLPAADVPFLAAHESYPGHHTEDSWKDVTLIRRGRPEFKVSLAVGIQPVIAEGIAQLATELVVDRESHDLVAGLAPAYDPEVGFRVAAGWRVLADISANLVLLQARGAGREELTEYARDWSLQPPERVEKSIRSLETRPFRGSPYCYTEGFALCKAFTGSDPARFKRLLTEQLTLEDLR